MRRERRPKVLRTKKQEQTGRDQQRGDRILVVKEQRYTIGNLIATVFELGHCKRMRKPKDYGGCIHMLRKFSILLQTNGIVARSLGMMIRTWMTTVLSIQSRNHLHPRKIRAYLPTRSQHRIYLYRTSQHRVYHTRIQHQIHLQCRRTPAYLHRTRSQPRQISH